jgi:hypothetical protein
MENTFAGVIAELEKAIKPIGFRIESVGRKDGFVPLAGESFRKGTDEEKLEVHITRAGSLSGRISWVSLSDNPDKAGKDQ